MSAEPYKVSMIIPVYKVEKYLRQCLDSVVAQTYHNLEVILVDDGSPDRCGEICDEYARKYEQFRVIHQKNQGQAAARNHAVQLASGVFIVFVDSDDLIVADHVEHLVAIQQKYDADLVIAGGIYWYENTPLPTIPPPKDVDRIVSAEEALSRMNYNRGMGAMPWAKLYQRDLLLAHPYPEGRIYEYLATTYKIVGDSKRIAYSRQIIYYWRQREGSTMHMKFDERQMAGIDAAKEQLAYMQERYPSVVPAAKARYMGKIVELMGIAMNSENSREIYKRLRTIMYYYKDVMADPKMKKSQKVRLFAMKCGYPLTNIVFRMHDKLKENKLSNR